jgi:hypothetical protein
MRYRLLLTTACHLVNRTVQLQHDVFENELCSLNDVEIPDFLPVRAVTVKVFTLREQLLSDIAHYSSSHLLDAAAFLQETILSHVT